MRYDCVFPAELARLFCYSQLDGERGEDTCLFSIVAFFPPEIECYTKETSKRRHAKRILPMPGRRG